MGLAQEEKGKDIGGNFKPEAEVNKVFVRMWLWCAFQEKNTLDFWRNYRALGMAGLFGELVGLGLARVAEALLVNNGRWVWVWTVAKSHFMLRELGNPICHLESFEEDGFSWANPQTPLLK